MLKAPSASAAAATLRSVFAAAVLRKVVRSAVPTSDFNILFHNDGIIYRKKYISTDLGHHHAMRILHRCFVQSHTASIADFLYYLYNSKIHRLRLPSLFQFPDFSHRVRSKDSLPQEFFFNSEITVFFEIPRFLPVSLMPPLLRVRVSI